jgi:RND superfamily putative drug exporter
MFIVQSGIFTGLTEGALLVVAASVIGSLTVLPALLSLLGDRVERGRIPFIGRFRHPEGESRIWGWVVKRTLARPALSLTLGVLALAILAVPAVRMHTAQPAASDLPRGIPVVQSNEHVQRTFPGSGTPATIVVTGRDVTAPAVADAIDQLTQQAISSGTGREPVSVRTSEDRTVAAISMPLAGNGENDASKRALTHLRDKLIPATLGAVAGVKAEVAGSTAINADVNALANSRTPLVFLFVLILAFGLLVTSFRSVVIAAKAIVLNLLSVAAAYGVLVAVFPWGWGENLLRFHSTGAIVAGLPVFLFVVLFSLTMDYHVFIVSRIREAMTGGMSTDSAVVHAVKSTAGVVTAAAAVMVMTFAIFATLRPVSSKEFGVGLATAVLLDATIVRGVLLPSAMKLLGEWNWYLPRWLEWIPQTRHEPHIITMPDVPKQREAAGVPALETELS